MLGTITDVISKTAALHDLAKRSSSLELEQEIADLKEKLLAVKKAYFVLRVETFQLREENLELRETINKLKDIPACKNTFRLH
jgi:hypothetical protein